MEKRLVSILVTITTITFSCDANRQEQTIISSEETSIDKSAGTCPYLTMDNKNNVVLSWVKELDTANAVFCYAISQDGGKTFAESIEIPGSENVHPHGENMPKIIFKPSGEIIAAWGASNPNPANKYSGLVYYSQSFDEGKSWTRPRSLTSDTASFDQRYFDLALLPNGEAGITWLDNRKKWNKEGSGLYYAVTNGKNGFKNEKLISGPCCQCCRTDLYVDKNNYIHVLYRAIISDSIRDMVHIVSTDDGNTFTPPARISQDNWVISGCPHTGPAIAESKQGIHFTWFTGGDGSGIYYNSSKDNGKTFSPRDTVSGKASKHCQIASLDNGTILIVWNENFTNANGSASRIGIEERSANGKSTRKRYITNQNSNSSFPVILTVDGNKAVVAYTENVNSKDHVMFKKLSFEE